MGLTAISVACAGDGAYGERTKEYETCVWNYRLLMCASMQLHGQAEDSRAASADLHTNSCIFSSRFFSFPFLHTQRLRAIRVLEQPSKRQILEETLSPHLFVPFQLSKQTSYLVLLSNLQ